MRQQKRGIKAWQGYDILLPQLASIISHFAGAFHRTNGMQKTRMNVRNCKTKQLAIDFVANRQNG